MVKSTALKRVDLYIAVEETATRIDLAKNLAKKLGFIPRKGSDSVVGAELRAPQGRHGHFHIDRISGGKTTPALLFTHFFLATDVKGRRTDKANGRPSIALRSVLQVMDEFVGNDAALVDTDARLNIHGLERKRPVLAPPVLVGTQMLRLSGAEYSGKRDQPGLYALRWSASRGTTELWLSYTWPWDRAGDLWKREEERCLGYVTQVL